MKLVLRTGSAGFTLLELVLVMSLIFVLAAVVVPRLGDSVPSIQVRTTAERLLSLARQARAGAVSEGRRWRLTLEKDRRSCLLAVEKDALKSPGSFEDPEGMEPDPYEWPEGVEVQVKSLGDSDPLVESGATLTFRPNGTCSDAELIVTHRHGDERRVRLEGALGAVHIYAP
jgi:type II secretory pathway pseudopilin PulG